MIQYFVPQLTESQVIIFLKEKSGSQGIDRVAGHRRECAGQRKRAHEVSP
jgi:hypothetical protein